MRHSLILFVLAALSASSALGQEAKKDTPDGDYSAELPRIPPTEPADAAKKFTLAPGFRIELVASEPQVASPVAMAFDEAGRIYVVEMRDYSEQDKEHLGRIRLLEDKDGDGHYETASIYAENLSWPTAILCYDGGVFVGAAPNLLFLKDTDGDGRINNESAEEKRVVFTGFGRSNVQGLMNSFQWGPDNRVYIAVSSSGAQLKKPGAEEVLLELRGRDLAFDPKTLKCESIAGGAQHGMTFTKWGERLVCSNSDHLQWIAYDDSHAAKNPLLPAPPARVSIAADGPQAEVFRTSPVEPWRIVRTRLRTTGVVPGLVEGGGRASGYFTSATGVTAVTPTAFPPVPGDLDGEWIVVGDVGSNLVHRKKLTIENGMLKGVRVDEKSELLTSSDNWFRPVQFANGPDGALYILDMYREVIEHPASLPPAIKKHLDLTSGRDRGRIWRLVKEDFKRAPVRDLGKLSTSELITCLGDENTWTRSTASRLLYERQNEEVLAEIRMSASRDGLNPIAMYHHLQMLAAAPKEQRSAVQSIGHLPIALLEKCLKSSNANLRLGATQICEKQLHDKLIPAILSLLADDSALIRRSAAFALAAADRSIVEGAMVEVAVREGTDPLTRFAVLSGYRTGTGAFFHSLAAHESSRTSITVRDWLANLVELAKRQKSQKDLAQIAYAVNDVLKADRTFGISLLSLLKAKPGSDLARELDRVTQGKTAALMAIYFETARKTAADRSQSVLQRRGAMQMLVDSCFQDERALLDATFSPSEGNELQVEALELVVAFDNPEIAPWLIAKWPNMTPAIRERTISVLTSRAVWLEAMLNALDDKTIAPQDIPPATKSLLAQHPSEKVRTRAATLFGQSTKQDRDAILTAYRPALTASGDAAKGKALFKQHCSACHQVEGVGNATGPNLAAMKARGAEAILTNVIDPNREVLPQFLSYIVELDDGRVVSGMIESESPTTIVLRKADGQKEDVQRVTIESLRSTGQSLMPDGLEKQLDQAAMADLLAYLLKAG